MAILFRYPLTDATDVPTGVTANGTLDPVGADLANRNNLCTLTPTDGSAAPAPCQLAILVSPDGTTGTWTAGPFILVAGKKYQADAQYMQNASLVHADPQTNITTVTVGADPALPVMNPPPPIIIPPPIQIVMAGKGPAPRVAVPVSSTYLPANAKFHNVVAITYRKCCAKPADPKKPPPKHIDSVVPVLAMFGAWSFLLPVPADYAADTYQVDIVFLNKDGIDLTMLTFGI